MGESSGVKAEGRAVIGYENKTMLPNGIFVTPGSIHMEDEKVPIFISYRYDREPVGWASDYQVSETGEISVKVELHDPEAVKLAETDDLFELYSAGMYLTGVIKQGVELKWARLRTVSLIPHAQAGTWA